MDDQISIFEFIDDPEIDTGDYLSLCDTCAYCVNGCCDYNIPLGRYCIQGDAYKEV